MAETQRVLSDEATEAFDHKWLFPVQVEHFSTLTCFTREKPFRVLDVGGGAGLFAQSLLERFPFCSLTILDISASSLRKAESRGLKVVHGSILAPPETLKPGSFDVVVFNMILHHLVGDSDEITEQNQINAMRLAATLLNERGRVVVNEYCYSGFIWDDSSGRLIYEITSSKLFAGVIRIIGRLFPKHLAANTVGVGVRFRPLRSWVSLGVRAGLIPENLIEGPADPPSLVRRGLLLIRQVRRSSAAFLIGAP